MRARLVRWGVGAVSLLLVLAAASAVVYPSDTPMVVVRGA